MFLSKSKSHGHLFINENNKTNALNLFSLELQVPSRGSSEQAEIYVYTDSFYHRHDMDGFSNPCSSLRCGSTHSRW